MALPRMGRAIFIWPKPGFRGTGEVFGVNLVVAKRNVNGWRIVTHEAAVPDPATAVQRLDVTGPH